MVSQIRPKSKHEILKLSSFLSDHFSSDYQTDIPAICQDESLLVCIDNYENYFDGMLVWDSPNFHIHLNSFLNNYPDSKKGRFTLAHELGHYFLDTHREGIKNGLIPPHPSHMSLIHSDQMEAEADYFAACLLMPEKQLKNFTGGRTFSLDIIREISDTFKVSLTSAAIRFAEIGTHEILVVFSEKNKVKWFTKSRDFPNLPFKFKVGQQLPPTSVAGEFFRKPNSKFTDIQEVQVDAWFYLRPWVPDLDMFEQCIYSDVFGYVISLIWFE